MGHAMRKMAVYLGLAEDGGHYRYGSEGYVSSEDPAGADGRPYEGGTRRRDHGVSEPASSAEPARGSAVRITTLHPRTYNEASIVGEHFRAGNAVLMELSGLADDDAKRLVDFAAGLILGLRGDIDRVASKVFLLSPPNVDVAAPDKADGTG